MGTILGMLGQGMAKAMVFTLAKLMTDTFLSRVLVLSLQEWAEQSENKFDDKVVKAIADAMDMDVVKLK